MTDDDCLSDTRAVLPPVGHAPVHHYEIRVQGRLAPRWSAWFDGLTVTADDDGTTVIAGRIADQSALHGVLQKLRDVGLPLLSLTEASPDAPIPDHEASPAATTGTSVDPDTQVIPPCTTRSTP